MRSSSRPLAPLLLALFLGGCNDDFHRSAPEIRRNAGKLPDHVARTIARRWPGARVMKAERVYVLSLDSAEYWGHYDLTLSHPQGRFLVDLLILADGTVRWENGNFFQDPLMETPGQHGLDLRCREY